MTDLRELADNAFARASTERSRLDERRRRFSEYLRDVPTDEAQRTPQQAAAMRAQADDLRQHEDLIEDLESVAGEYERRARQDVHLTQRARQEGATDSSYSAARATAVDPYRPDGDSSYFLDLSAARSGDTGARERLDVHRQVTLERLRGSDEPILRSMLRAAEHGERAVTTGSGSAGVFLPPAWLLDEYLAIFRPARATVDALHSEPLPSVGMQVMAPKLTQGTVVAAQSVENTVVATQDVTTGSLTAPVNTLAGHLPLSYQARDRSGSTGGFDQVVQQDLLAAYIAAAGTYVLNGTGASNQPLGILNLAGTQAITYTDGTPAFMGAGKLYSKVAQAVQAIQLARFLPPTAIIMHPRRWAWLAVQTDTAGRAVVLPSDGNPANASAAISTGAVQGKVGRMFGLDVIADPNIPTNLGAGTNQDPVIVGRTDDSWWFEDGPYIKTFEQTLGTQLTLELVLYSYVALAHRNPGSFAIINGTGLVAPTF